MMTASTNNGASAPAYREFDGPESLITTTLALLTEQLGKPSESPSAVMVTGGRTPVEIYRRLAEAPASVAPTTHVLLSDERHVPFDSDQSNFARLAPALQAMGMTRDHVLNVNPALPLDAAAVDLDSRIRAFFDAGGRIPLGLLGLGPDGHLASLFSEEDVARSRGKCAIPVRREEGPDRVSVAADVIQSVEKLIFVVTGREKQPAVQALLQRSQSIPAGIVTADMKDVAIWFCGT